MIKLYYKLWKEKKDLAPRRSFKTSLKKELDNVWNLNHQTKLSWYKLPVFRFGLIAVCVLIFLASTGTGAYAYSSSNVTEGSLLYPVKKAVEKVEEKIKKTPVAKAKFYLKQIERRESERKVLEKRFLNKPAVKEKREVQLQQLEDKIDKTEQELEKINAELTTSSLKEQVKQRLEKRQIKLEKKKIRDNEKLLERQKKIIEQQEKKSVPTSTRARSRDGVKEKFNS